MSRKIRDSASIAPSIPATGTMSPLNKGFDEGASAPRFDEDYAAVKVDPRGGIFTMTRAEIAQLQTVYLAELAANKADRKQAADAVGVSLREIRALEADDPEFKQKCDAILEADDAELADAARNALHTLIGGGSERAMLTAAMYLDKTRGGYGQTSKVEHEVRQAPDADIHPVNLGDYAVRSKKLPQPVQESPGVMAHDVEWQ